MAAMHPLPVRGSSSADADAADTERLPRRFGKYTLVRKLATGGMAELFLAIQKSVAGFEKLVVIKRILPAMNHDRAFVDMLLHEARIAATLSHPNIVQVFDVGTFDDTYFLAMEHVHGEDLRSIVRQMKKKDVVEFPLEHALSVVLGMCAGLAYSHDQHDLDGTALHIVHRDVSPQNVIVTFTGDVKIVDFGIAKSDARVEEIGDQTGRLKGKIPYMSPEQARGETIDWRTDIFATGVVLFELTTGTRLFKAASEYESLKRICTGDYPLPSQSRPGYPRELETIVMRALARDRRQRWQSAREMQRAIEELVRKERLAVSTIALSEFMQRLFEDKLASQRQALLEGKQLADILALETAAESLGSIDTRSRTASSPPTATTVGATRTVTELRARPPGSGWTAAVAIAAAIATAALTLWWAGQRAPAVTASAAHGVIAIASDPPGAAIFVNGEARSLQTPATLPRLALGTPYDVRLTKDGFADATRTVTLTDEDPSSAVSVVLRRNDVSRDSGLAPSSAMPMAPSAPAMPAEKDAPVTRP
jgi:serine/threonine protein kinase